MRPGWSLRARLSIAFLAIFCGSMALAMAAYAGGSWLDPRAPSHSWWENFWCDLVREPAHNGLPNARSVVLASIGFAALALSLAAFWLEISELFADWRRAFVRSAGLVSAAGTAAVALVPSDRFPVLHGPFVLTAGTLGLACGFICAGWALRHYAEARAFGAVSLVLLCAAAVNLVLYVQVAYFRASDTIVLPAAQKLATLALVVWIATGLYLSAGRPKR